MENKCSIPEITTMIDDVLIIEYDETKVKPGEEDNLIKDLKEKLNCNVVLVQSHVKIVGKIRCYPTPKTHQDMAAFKSKAITPNMVNSGITPIHE